MTPTESNDLENALKKIASSERYCVEALGRLTEAAQSAATSGIDAADFCAPQLALINGALFNMNALAQAPDMPGELRSAIEHAQGRITSELAVIERALHIQEN